MATQDDVNRRVYAARAVARSYLLSALNRVETMTLLKYQGAIAGRDVLDLGVGAGRTAIYLAPLARRYEGIDYSPAMIECVRARLPGLSVRLGDIRDLSDFADASFDFVFGSSNVIDAVSHDDRLRTLAEMRRVLRAGGCFAFSSHNRKYVHAQRGPRIDLSRNPVTQARNVVRWARQVVNHARIGKMRMIGADYDLLNDPGHDFSCLHYYVDQETQRRQLDGLGFQVLDVLDQEGRSLAPSEIARESAALMYVARRAA